MYFKTGDFKIRNVTMTTTQKDGKINYFVHCPEGSIPENFAFGETVGCYSDADVMSWEDKTTDYLRVYVNGNTIVCTHEPPPPEPTLEELKQRKKHEIQGDIYTNQRKNYVIKYSTTEVVEHEDEFSSGTETQSQILNAYIQILHGADSAMLKPENGKPKMYSAEVITNLYNTIIQRTWKNSIEENYLMDIIEKVENKDDLNEIFYGMTYPVDIQEKIDKENLSISLQLAKVKGVKE